MSLVAMRRIFVVFLALIAVSTGVLFYKVIDQQGTINSQQTKTAHLAHRNHKLAASTHDSLCSLRANIEQRVSASKDYLAKHPHGAPGIPKATIEASIQRDQSALAALETLRC